MLNLLSTNVAYADVDTFVKNVNKLIINPLIAFLFGLAVAYFLYGVFEFISNQTNEEKKTTGRNHMIWGVVGIVIMMGVFSIIKLIGNTLGVEVDPRAGTVQMGN